MNKLLSILFSFVLAVNLQAQPHSTYLAQMQALKERFGVSFIYDSSLPLNGSSPRVDSQTSLSHSLRTLFEGSEIDFTIRGRSVILRRRTEANTGAERYVPIFDTLRPSHIESAWRDTLAPAIKTGHRRMAEGIGKLQGDLPAVRSVVSPLGEGDPLRWVQRLPGVATGADGSSALYVRGGNMGNNLITLDGVPVYGYSHLLGLTTVLPQEAIEGVELSKGGFEGGQGNFTSSHLRIGTRTPGADGYKTSVALNNFLASARTEGRKGRFSYLASGRISPLALEYKAFRKALPDLLNFEQFGALVGDLYGKVQWDLNAGSRLDAFILGSVDRYTFTPKSGSEDMLGWNNVLGQVRYNRSDGDVKTEVRAYANRFASAQSTRKVYSGREQELSLSSQMTEFSLSASQDRPFGERFRLSYGLNLRDALFNPGQVGVASNWSNAFLSTLWLQGNYEIPEKLSLMAAVRGNLFTRFMADNTFFVPDAALSAKWTLLPFLSLEATLDRTSQYYHTLEGLPVGWSVDMLVPSVSNVKPETMWQAGLGVDLVFGAHSLQLGYFHKRMDGLVFFQYAPSLFNGALAAWEEHVDTGLGFSYGGEFLYEFLTPDWQVQVSYTLSRTWREGFATVLEGAPFNAKFDRRHVLNASASWKGIQVALTYQSGHWENSASKKATMHILDQEWTAEYFSGVNDFHMPDLFRLDVGYRFGFRTGRLQHEVNLGVCNATNHFNPFMLYYDAETKGWKEMALLPVLPNFSWRVTF
ncbi:MAG: TonB-dependent receptor [Bacteroidales bacterium]|nr:TonB-dependent receptor [Bacteroidales bacterium]